MAWLTTMTERNSILIECSGVAINQSLDPSTRAASWAQREPPRKRRLEEEVALGNCVGALVCGVGTQKGPRKGLRGGSADSCKERRR